MIHDRLNRPRKDEIIRRYNHHDVARRHIETFCRGLHVALVRFRNPFGKVIFGILTYQVDRAVGRSAVHKHVLDFVIGLGVYKFEKVPEVRFGIERGRYDRDERSFFGH